LDQLDSDLTNLESDTSAVAAWDKAPLERSRDNAEAATIILIISLHGINYIR